MNRFCYALDLVDDEILFKEYIDHHTKVWPEIQKSILDSDINLMEIYCVGNRLFMITDLDENFSSDKKESNNLINKKTQEWENLMWKYQKAIPTTNKGEK